MNLGERSTQSLPTLLRRDSLQAEMGLFAFSGSHSSGGNGVSRWRGSFMRDDF